MTQFEEQLSEKLKAHADQVRPNPETWTRVQEGIQRRQRFRWVYAAAGAATLAAVVAVAVVTLPVLLNRSGVEFEPPVATQPEPDEPSTEPGDPAIAPATPDLLLASDNGLVTLASGAAAVVEGTEGVSADSVAVVPGSTPDQLDAVFTADCALRRLISGSEGARVEDVALSSVDGCAAGPRFSPDGGHLGWIEEADGAHTLATVDWDAAAGQRDAQFGLELPEGTSDVRIVEWAWTGGDGESLTGFLALAVKDVDGLARIFMLPIERQGDGALALPEGSTPSPLDGDDQRIVAYQQDACPAEPVEDCPQAVTWTLRVGDDGTLELRHEGQGEQIWAAGGSALEAIDPDSGRVWLEVSGKSAVLGDGLGSVVQLTGENDWTELTPLPGVEGAQIVHGGTMTPPPPPAQPEATPTQEPPSAEPTPTAIPDMGTTPEPTDEPTPENTEPAQTEEPPDPGEGGLPAPVADTRQALLAAAEAGDLDGLAALADSQSFTYSFGSSGDPAGYWRAEIANGVDVLGQLRAVLGLPHTTADGGDAGDIYVWPFAYDRPYESLASAELEVLEAAVGPDVMETYAQSGQYLGYRVGILADGTWQYFVAGD